MEVQLLVVAFELEGYHCYIDWRKEDGELMREYAGEIEKQEYIG